MKPQTSQRNQLRTRKPDAFIGLGFAGARRAALSLSPDGQAMLFAVMRWVMLIDTETLVLGDASRGAGIKDEVARRGIYELQKCGLLKKSKGEATVLHPLFA